MEAKKVLIVYYSRTGTTRAAAEAMASELGADLEELIDTKSRGGPLGFAIAAKDAALKRPTAIEDVKRDPAAYDLVLIGTPVWAGTMCCAVRACLTQQKGRLPDVGFFLTTMSSGAGRTFRHMAELCGKEPVAALPLFAREVKSGRHLDKVKAFAEQLRAG